MSLGDVAAQILANREHWDDRADIHAASRYYGLESVLAQGPTPIAGPDEDEVGPVEGRSLLHLHCHIGTETLRWAALGADATGIDLSPRSIEIARSLAARLGLRARFIEADVYDLPTVLTDRFDIVYASYGVTCWVPDISRWAAIAGSLAKPGAFVYLADGHPFDVAFDPERFERSSYFDRGPRQFEDERTYTDGDQKIARPVNYRWTHTLGDIVTAFAAAGLRIDFLHEHPHIPRDDDAATGATERRRTVPTSAPALFSLKASKPSTG